jgi:hypothetical protein
MNHDPNHQVQDRALQDLDDDQRTRCDSSDIAEMQGEVSESIRRQEIHYWMLILSSNTQYRLGLSPPSVCLSTDG